MAVAWVSVNGSNGNSGSASPAMPASIAAGNLLLAECILNTANLSITVSAGWTIIQQINGSGASYLQAYKIAVGADAAPTFTWDGTTQSWNANCSRLTGAFTGAQGPIGNKNIATGSSTSAGCSAIVAGSAAAFMFEQTSTISNSQTVPLPTGYTSDSNFVSATGSERMAHKATTNVGDSSGSTVVTITTTKWVSGLLEIRSQAPAAVNKSQGVIIW